jgi:hypothetical protein
LSAPGVPGGVAIIVAAMEGEARSEPRGERGGHEFQKGK